MQNAGSKLCREGSRSVKCDALLCDTAVRTCGTSWARGHRRRIHQIHYWQLCFMMPLAITITCHGVNTSPQCQQLNYSTTITNTLLQNFVICCKI